jgi:hypothetical protein
MTLRSRLGSLLLCIHNYISLQLFSDLCLLPIGMATKSGDFAEQSLLLILFSGFYGTLRGAGTRDSGQTSASECLVS